MEEQSMSIHKGPRRFNDDMVGFILRQLKGLFEDTDRRMRAVMQRLTSEEKGASMNDIRLDRTVELLGEVDGKAFEGVSRALKDLHAKDPGAWMRLQITSPGGLVTLGFALYDLIMWLKPKLQTVIFGEANSMAILLALAGDHRLMSKRSYLFLHELDRTLSKDRRLTVTDCANALHDLMTDQQLYIQIVTERTGGKVSTEQVLEMMRRETRLTAEEAVRLGFVNEILT